MSWSWVWARAARTWRSGWQRPAWTWSGSRSIHKAGNEGLVKLVGDRDRGVLVGATSMGPWGREMLGLLTLAVHAEVPTRQLRHMMYAYPTFHRAIGDAVRNSTDGPEGAL